MTTAMADMPINTKKAERRALEFDTLDDLSAELDRIQAGHNAGTLSTTGNWSPGQIMQHCSILMKCALDGFPPGKPGLLLRIFLKVVIKPVALKGGPPPAGIKLPQDAAYLIPPEDTTFDKGMGDLREALARVREKGEKFSVPSPVFGKMTHDQWTKLQLGHCKLHLGFLKLG